MFMHATFSHLFFNMFALWMFGNVLENFWGSKRFLTYYMITGIGAAVVQLAVTYFRLETLYAQVSPEDLTLVLSKGQEVYAEGKNFIDGTMGEINILINNSTIGASGAVFGILLAFGMLFPNTLLYIYFAIPIKAKWFVVLYGAAELFFGIANNPNDNVAHFAHLGGMLFGFILII
jgi:membrane associated rhomboid family serine protease